MILTATLFVTRTSHAPADRESITSTVVVPGGRSFILHRLRHHGPSPLVIVLHMAAHTAQSMEVATGLSDMGDKSGFSVAYGQGSGGFWNAAGCCGGDTADDLGYLRALIATASKLTPVDHHRIYLIGASNGGMMAYRAICEMPGVFAAAGIVSGALLRGVDCGNTRVNVYEIHGTADTTVPLGGGIGFEGVNFPPQSTDLSRVGKGSSIHLQKYQGGHSYPPWATSILVKWLAGYSTAA